MYRFVCITVAALSLAGTGTASATPCGDDIERLSKQVNEEGRDAISASSGGQAAAGKRAGQGVTGATSGTEAPAAPPGKSAEAGLGAEKVQAAKVALDEARTLDGKGDAEGCRAALDKVRLNLAQTP